MCYVMSKIESFIIVDFETTGIERDARITEIAVIAVSRDHILSAATKSKGLPRVMSKFTICVNPHKPINPIAARISGLNNDLLQGQKPFDSTAFNILENFLCRFPQPLCLIAHNGDKFDFPILQAELQAFRQALPDHILCADSMKCFKALLGPRSTCYDSQVLARQVTSQNLNLEAQVVITNLGNCIAGGIANCEISSMTEMTYVAPTSVIYTRSKRRCTSRTTTVSNVKKMPNSFKLSDIYRHFFTREPKNNHTAYGDAQNLLECIIAVGSDFLCWTDTNARKLNEVKTRWSKPLN